jgi:hypothetical protein
VTRAACALVFFAIAFQSAAAQLPIFAPLGPVYVSLHGIGCRSYQHPDKVGPPSYAARDIKAKDVPRLTGDQLAVIRKIEKYVAPTYLRFAFLSLPGGRQFIVFNAVDGPCVDAAPGYWVMNATYPNSFYQPGQNPFAVHSIPGDIVPTPGPWMK